MRRLTFVMAILITLGWAYPLHVTAQSNDAAWLLAQINALRQSKGIAPLALNPLLTQSATRHSGYLSTHVWVNPHVEDNGSTPQTRIHATGYTGDPTGENVVGGSTATVQWAFQWWVNEPIHYANMLARWTEVGIGIADGPYGRYYTLDFGSGGGGNDHINPVNQSNQANPVTPVPPIAPTRRPTHVFTKVPTAIPTLTYTPTTIFTKQPTFTPTVTYTPPPPTMTAIVMEVSAPMLTPIASAQSIALAMTPVKHDQVNISFTADPPPSNPAPPSNGLRDLIPIAVALQITVIGGLVITNLFKRHR